MVETGIGTTLISMFTIVRQSMDREEKGHLIGRSADATKDEGSAIRAEWTLIISIVKSLPARFPT